MSDTPITSLVLELLALARREELDLLAGGEDAGREAEGTPEAWSAKDTVVHIAAWKQRHAEKLAMAVRGEKLPRWTDDDLINALNAGTYGEFQHRPWSEVSAFAERAHNQLVAQVESMSEAELADGNRYPTSGGESLWGETLGNGTWHPFTHMAALARARGDQAWIRRLQETEMLAHERELATMEQASASSHERATAMYNLACYNALADRPARAMELLRGALALAPDLTLHAKHDSDFASLRDDPRFTALVASARDAELIAVAAAHEGQRTGAALIVDVRDPGEYAAGHIAGATNMPLGQLRERLAELPPEQLIVTYCNMYHRGTSRGERAAALVAESGRHARALDGGYPGWRERGLPVE